MKCKIEGCDRDAMYMAAELCQKHYFRIMRNGTSDLIRSRKYRTSNPAGYQRLYEPSHSLANKDGYVYEHRKVVYDKYGYSLPDCEICGKPTAWETCHIDHKDEDVTNNNIKNLRPLCGPCNTFRGEQMPYEERSGCIAIEYDGEVKTPADWARDSRVNVPAHTIRNRYKRGLPVHDCLFMPKLTHNGNEPKKYQCKTNQKSERLNAVSATINGITLTAEEWSRDSRCVVSSATIRNRIRDGWPQNEELISIRRHKGWERSKGRMNQGTTQ